MYNTLLLHEEKVRVRHIPAEPNGWPNIVAEYPGTATEDEMEGSEVFGDSEDDSNAWGTMYDKREWTRISVEGVDGGYKAEYYNNEEFTGNMQMEPLLNDMDLIKTHGGADVYVYMSDKTNCYRYDENTIYGADC